MKNKKTIEMFEAGKKSVYCKKCGNNFLTDKYPEICPFCKSRKLVFEPPEREYKKEVHVIVGVYSGIIEDTEVFTKDKDATKCEKELCKEYGIPFNQKKRERYYQSNGEHEIKHLITEVH